jgi:cell division protein FtsQ
MCVKASAKTTSSTTINYFFLLLRIIILIALVVGIYSGWKAIHNPRLFPVKVIKVQASFQHVNQQVLEQTISPYMTASFFGLNVSQLQAQLLQMPWIANAQIQRIWPATIVIKITEQQPVARWGQNSLINSAGEIFTPPATTFPASLPILNGINNQAGIVWQNYQQMSTILAPLKLNIAELDVNAREAIRLVLNSGTEILLGRNDTISHLQRFVNIYPKIFHSAEGNAQTVDLRYDNGLAITWRNKIK